MRFSGGIAAEAVLMLQGIQQLLRPSGERAAGAASDQDLASMLGHVIEHLGGPQEHIGRSS